MPCPELSTELWNQILSRNDLDYITLKKCQRVCQTFKAIIEHPDFDKILFRMTIQAFPNDTDGEEGAEVKIHPALQAILHFGESEDRFHPYIAGLTNAKHEIPQQLLTETATMPPCKQIHVTAKYEHGRIAPFYPSNVVVPSGQMSVHTFLTKYALRIDPRLGEGILMRYGIDQSINPRSEETSLFGRLLCYTYTTQGQMVLIETDHTARVVGTAWHLRNLAVGALLSED